MSQQRQFSARMDNLDAAMAFVQTFCAEHLAARDDSLRLQLLVEELFTNTVTHGHGGDCESPVIVELALEANGLGLRFTDWAPEFDPTAVVAIKSAVPEQVGGAGLRLLASLAREMAYARSDGANRLTLTLAGCSAAMALENSRENAAPPPPAAQSNSRA